MTSKSLRIERHPSTSLRKWFERRQSINFEPPYQRKGNIWSQADRALLIDTIINGLDIPKFYVSDFGWRSSKLSNDKFVYAVIDGKQRFQTIFSFMLNEFPLSDTFVWRVEPDLPLAGKYYSDLSDLYPSIAKLIDQFAIDVMSVSTDDPEDINLIFKRLNKGKALVGAEVRNASLGPVADMIRVVATHDFFQHSVSFDTRRLGDFNAAAKLLLFEYIGFPTSTKKKDLDRFVELEGLEPDLIEASGLKCTSHLDMMFQVFNERDSVLRSAGQLPVFYWVVRSTPRQSHAFLRSFLYEFDRRRGENRRLQTQNRLNEVNQTLARYDVLNRNTNDAGSHRARVSILLGDFAHWLRRHDEHEIAESVRQQSQIFNQTLIRKFGHEWLELEDIVALA